MLHVFATYLNKSMIFFGLFFFSRSPSDASMIISIQTLLFLFLARKMSHVPEQQPPNGDEEEEKRCQRILQKRRLANLKKQ